LKGYLQEILISCRATSRDLKFVFRVNSPQVTKRRALLCIKY
jgi:hypothetical protein